MSELDGVSAAIGELKGLAKGHNDKLDNLCHEFSQLKTQVIALNTDGCARGKSNGHRIEKLEVEVQDIESGRISGKDWGKLTAAVAGISGVIAGLIKAIESSLSK